MTITPTTLTRIGGVAAAAAGLIFVGVQINHPHVDVTTITSTEMVVRMSLKLLMAGLALVGITGMYVRQIRQTGLLGLIGWLVLSAGYLLIFATSFVPAYVLPSLAATDPSYVNDYSAAATGGAAQGDLGLVGTALSVQGVAYLVGGLAFGVALFRARVLARWACLLLAVGGLAGAALSAMPDAFYRLLALPNGIAMVALGVSLWRSAQTQSPTDIATDSRPRTVTAGAA